MPFTLITVFGFVFIFIMTTLGSAVVYFFKKEIPEKINALFLGFASVVMLAASVWSLLLPARSSGENAHKAFLKGAASGVAEPIFAVVGYFLASWLRVLQPWLLSFSAGAMVFVAAQDLIPDAKCEKAPRTGAWGVLFGFAIMMALDIALGG